MSSLFAGRLSRVGLVHAVQSTQLAVDRMRVRVDANCFSDRDIKLFNEIAGKGDLVLADDSSEQSSIYQFFFAQHRGLLQVVGYVAPRPVDAAGFFVACITQFNKVARGIFGVISLPLLQVLRVFEHEVGSVAIEQGRSYLRLGCQSRFFDGLVGEVETDKANECCNEANPNTKSNVIGRFHVAPLVLCG